MQSVTLAFVLSFTTFISLASASDASSWVDPNQTLEQLRRGNQRYVEGKPNREHQDVYRRKELAKGQKPSTVILSCSDSRVPPELVFDQGLGDVFTVRVAGNVLGADQVASMEYAVEHLGASLIVVMGHESCGAVKAALDTPKGQKVGSKDLSALVATIHQNMESGGRKIASLGNSQKNDPKLRDPVKANINGVIKNLLARSELIREQVKQGKLKLQGALYGLESGAVDFWDSLK